MTPLAMPRGIDRSQDMELVRLKNVLKETSEHVSAVSMTRQQSSEDSEL